MTSMTVITKSFAPDLELCADLNASVLRNTPSCTNHHIIVRRKDLRLFDRLAHSRTRVCCEAEYLPSTFFSVPYSNVTVNLTRPLPPVRGWIMQQIVKLAAAAGFHDEVVVVVDSDVEFIRPFSVETFVNDGCVRFYRKPDCVDERLPQHLRWHRVARSLLGLPPGKPPYPDYIASLVAWDPKIVRQLLARVSAVTRDPWPTAIAKQLHFSESTLYGVFVDNVLGAPANSFASEDPLCLAHWDTTALTRASADRFLSALKRTDIAAMISAKSRTPLEVRRSALGVHRTDAADARRPLEAAS